MEARHRLVEVAVRPMALCTAGAVLLVALSLFVLITLNTLPRTTHPTMPVAPTVVTSPEQPAK